MTSMKTGFMSLWDGFTTEQNSRVMVLAATNRPSELDEAILQCFTQTFEIGMPNKSDIEGEFLNDEKNGNASSGQKVQRPLRQSDLMNALKKSRKAKKLTGEIRLDSQSPAWSAQSKPEDEQFHNAIKECSKLMSLIVSNQSKVIGNSVKGGKGGGGNDSPAAGAKKGVHVQLQNKWASVILYCRKAIQVWQNLPFSFPPLQQCNSTTKGWEALSKSRSQTSRESSKERAIFSSMTGIKGNIPDS
ncbi:ATPase family AAA domain-containing protein 1-like [Canna indica]|uniref:ATPase family AAA domain-containing protein 1-like n=1 Tax=Canna indica TaxID=4628 RepID=A0AAQ3Q8H3_9LILI|nr:ATPase family AAA domain-containing protein 1-like [Canna indica]